MNLKRKVPFLKEKIIKNYYKLNEKVLTADLNIKILNEIKRKKFKIIVIEFDALPGIKAIANIYVPENDRKKFPTVFSVPGCAENLWSDSPQQTDPQHRMELLASNDIVGITSISLCSNSGFTKNHRYEIFKFVIGEDVFDTDLAILIWMRLKRLHEKFNFIDNKNLGITGYSYGGSIINHILYIDEEIKNVALVGSNLRDIFNNQNFINYSFEEIVTNENENYYWSSGGKAFNQNIQNTLISENLEQNIWRSFLQFDFRKNFYFIFGKNDTAINQGRKRNIIKNINFINRANRTVDENENIEFIENDQNHNFSKENNFLVVKFFKRKFYSNDQLDYDVKIKKNSKNELSPIIHQFDLKKYYVDSFLNKLNGVKYVDDVDHIKKILNKNLRLQLFDTNSIPILLLNQNLKLDKKNINSSFFSVNTYKNLETYFYEFLNVENNNGKINFLITSKEINFKKLKSLILSGYKTYVLVLPGYSISSPRFTTVGNVSKYLLDDKSNPLLIGNALQSINLINQFINNTKNNKVVYFANDFESNIVFLFYKILKDNFFELNSSNFSNNLDEFLNTNSGTTLPAILFIDNLHEIFPIINNFDLKKYNFQLNSKTNYENYIFSN